MQSPQNIQLKRCISVHTHKTATENIINVEGETALCFTCICLYVCFKSGSEDVTNVSVRVCVCVCVCVCVVGVSELSFEIFCHCVAVEAKTSPT